MSGMQSARLVRVFSASCPPWQPAALLRLPGAALRHQPVAGLSSRLHSGPGGLGGSAFNSFPTPPGGPDPGHTSGTGFRPVPSRSSFTRPGGRLGTSGA
eukprot:485438-Hanusia_phi.AAC.1